MMTPSLQRGLAAALLSAALVAGTGPAALAQSQRAAGQKPAAKPAAASSSKAKPAGRAGTAARSAQAATGPGGASLVSSHGDWGVYTAQTGRSKICYALSQPQERLPKNLNRDPAYLFVSF